ncbi:peptidase M1 [Nitrospira sp.]|nr:peptidase M1 [Nitrospira sp.]
MAADRLTLHLPSPMPTGLEFTLAPGLRVTRLRAEQEGRTLPVRFTSNNRLSRDMAGESTQVVAVILPDTLSSGLLHLEWRYEGIIHDSPREPRHLRFVTPSDTSGYIGPEGVYLSSESQWYPDLGGSLPTFRVNVTLPVGWSAVTHGQMRLPVEAKSDATHTTIWDVPDPTEALTLVANQFIRSTREWADETGRTVLLETDLLPANAKLADEYLDASARYLEVYSRILGPYPFTKFAVVENFFPSGLGMPSFTLLGSGVIRRHYTQPYALGHEIVHSWIGNSVFNRSGTGNWVEGLTTYLANYYYDELQGQMEQAREQRRLMLAGYAVYVPPDRDYPVAQFKQKFDQTDNAIGYQKSAMVFHMLRCHVGEAVFWRTVKRLGEEFRGRQVDWDMLEELFSQESGQSLGLFFDQWIDGAGAPVLTASVRALPLRPDSSGHAESGAIEVHIRQTAPTYRLTLPLVVLGKNGARYETSVALSEGAQSFRIPVLFDAIAVQVDPDFHVFRRLDRADLPPMLNLLVTDNARTIVVSKGRDSEEESIYRRIVERLTQQAGGGDAGTAVIVVESLDRADSAVAGSVLFLGPDQLKHWRERADPSCASQVREENGRISVDGEAFEGAGLALLVSCHRAKGSGHVVTLFFGATPEAAGTVARLLFFYGWQSYLVFRDGAVVARGDIGPEMGRIQVTRD